MGVLEQVIQMRESGMPDQDISSQLQEQGVSPKAINDALNQANIKSAVGNGMEEMTPGNGEYVPTPHGKGMYQPQAQQEYVEEVYTPTSQGTRTEEYYQDPYQGAGQSYAGTDADTMIEIAQQVFSEKIRKIQQQIDDMSEFRTIYQTRTDAIYERLKKIEGTIDRLQSAILEKVGSYGQGIESVKKELSMMQDTYGKIVDAVADKHYHQSAPQEHHTAPIHPQTEHKVNHTVSKKHHKKK